MDGENENETELNPARSASRRAMIAIGLASTPLAFHYVGAVWPSGYLSGTEIPFDAGVFVFLGSAITSLLLNPFRRTGFAPPACLIAFVLFGFSSISNQWNTWISTLPCALFGFAMGMLLFEGFPDSKRSTNGRERILSSRPSRWDRRAFLIFLGFLALASVGVALAGNYFGVPVWVFQIAKWYAFALAAFATVWSWLHYNRAFCELCAEPMLWILYSIRAHGPGSKAVPPTGPCLVIANHACWFDPCFIGKILPRATTPMMTSRFFNVWFLKPILKHIVKVIVVPESPLRREAPELEQVIEALRRGELVVIFPEGFLRRKEELPLRRFGQGVWRILKAMPDTPVVACWIEGGWKSKFSYWNGPPTKNKPMDFRRKIEIGVGMPEAIPAEILNDQLSTRLELMNRVSAARLHVGLEPLPPFERANAATSDAEFAGSE